MAKTVAFFPEGAYGPTNNCVGIADVLRQRGWRVVFIAERSLQHRGWAFDAHQADLRFGLSAARANDSNDLVDVGECK